MAHGPVVLERVHKLVDKNDLALSKHDRVGKLKHKVPGIEAYERRVGAIHLHEMTLRHNVGGNFQGLQLDLLANAVAFVRFV